MTSIPSPSLSPSPSNALSPDRWRVRWLVEFLGPVLALMAVVGFFIAAEAMQLAGQWRQAPDDRYASFTDFYSHQATFWTSQNARNILVQAAPVAAAALGMTLVIIAAGIDLSAGTAVALAAVVLAWCYDAGYPPWVALSLCLAVGCVTGFVNGSLICALKVVPFIVTLGTMTIYLGLAKFLANETTIKPPREVVEQSAWLRATVDPNPPDPAWLLMPTAGWVILGLAILLAVVLKYTVFGRHVFAVGSNESTARLCGINVPMTKIAVYTLAGAFIGVAGMFKFARLSIGDPTAGIGMELKIIAAVVIGGGSLSGGRGSVLGTLAGAAIMQTIASGCTHLGFGNPAQDVILGVIIAAAVALDQLRQRRLA